MFFDRQRQELDHQQTVVQDAVMECAGGSALSCCPPLAKHPSQQNILPPAFALTVYIQFSLIISFLVIKSRAMGSILTNHDDEHIGIDSVKD
jgi:hypothetical protein